MKEPVGVALLAFLGLFFQGVASADPVVGVHESDPGSPGMRVGDGKSQPVSGYLPAMLDVLSFWDAEEAASPEAVRRAVGAFKGGQDRDWAERETAAYRDAFQASIARLHEQRDAASDPPASPAWMRLDASTGRFRIDARPVFPLGFSWFDEVEHAAYHAGHDAGPRPAEFRATLDPEIRRAKTLGVGVVELTVRVSSLVGVPDEEAQATVDWLSRRIAHYAEHGIAVNPILIWTRTQRLDALHPGLGDSPWHFFRIDVDHPAFRPVARQALARLIPMLAEHDNVVSFCLANEPEFPLKGWTEHTLSAYRNALRDRYPDIDALNQAWGSEHASFNAIPRPTEASLEEAGHAERIDALGFNRDRGTQALAYLAEVVREFHPDLPLHVKLQDISLVGVGADVPLNGIDRRALAASSDLHGIDTRMLPVADRRAAASTWHDDRYALHWLPGLMAYDYLRSVDPAQTIFDTELHAFSTSAMRLPHIEAQHAVACMWLLAAHGSTGNIVWYWQRRDTPSARLGALQHAFYASLTTQPALFLALCQSNAELNEHARVLEAISDAPRTIHLLWSDDTLLAEPMHMHALHTAYEAAAQVGASVGVVAPQELATWPADQRSLVLVPGQAVDRYAAELEAYEAKGAALLRLPDVAEADIRALRQHIAQAMDQHGIVPAVRLKPTDGDGLGVLYRSVWHEGARYTFVVGVGSEVEQRQAVGPQGEPKAGVDLRTGQRIDGAVSLAPLQVRLIRWDAAPAGR
ncbi:MAG: beta-galactosidase [Planctomycetota bacterium]